MFISAALLLCKEALFALPLAPFARRRTQIIDGAQVAFLLAHPTVDAGMILSPYDAVAVAVGHGWISLPLQFLVQVSPPHLHTPPPHRSAQKMTKQNVALVRELGGPVEIAQVDIPTPDVDQVLVKVLYTGVCQSDLHTAEGVAAGADGKPILNIRLPHIGGHEGVGDVIEVGSRVKNVKVGDRVGVRFSAWVCRDCEFCLRGCEQYCPRALNHLHHIPGSFSQYCVLESTYITRVPKDIDPSVVGPVLCAGVTVWAAIKKMAIRPGSWTVVSGAGGGLGYVDLSLFPTNW